jgi:hypothetical protein
MYYARVIDTKQTKKKEKKKKKRKEKTARDLSLLSSLL